MSLVIRKEGMLTTIQGLGRYGLQRFGINPRGAMDRTAVRLINLLLGNAEDEPAIEMHFPAGEMFFEESCVVALGGADFNATLNDEKIENWRPVFAEQLSVLKFKQKLVGNRCYLAVRGGFNLALGGDKRSKSKAAPIEGLPLKKTDRIELKVQSTSDDIFPNRQISNSLLPVYSNFPTVRLVAGGEFDLLSESDKRSLAEEDFVITNDSNRMGYRLRGPGLRVKDTAEMVSAAVSFGTIQLLPDGQLIILMADHQTSGGYPRIANTISVDLPLLAQLGAKDKVAFNLVDIEEAERLTMQFEQDIRRLRTGCRFGRYW